VERPYPRGGPQHAVFVDDTGRRARRAQRLYRTVAVLCVGALALLVVSLLNGVPLPGLTQPVPLPSNEPAHARGAVAAPPVGSRGAAARNRPQLSPVAAIPSGSDGAVATGASTAAPGRRLRASVHPGAPATSGGATTLSGTTVPAPTHGRRTTPAPASSHGRPSTGRQTTPPVAVTSAPARGRHTTPPTARHTTPATGRHTTPAAAPTARPSTGRHTTPAAPAARPTAPRLL
jgi:hypothetical protein